MIIQSVPQTKTERLILGRDFNGHIRTKADRYGTTHGGLVMGKEIMVRFQLWTLRCHIKW